MSDNSSKAHSFASSRFLPQCEDSDNSMSDPDATPNESSDDSIMEYSFDTAPPDISQIDWDKYKVDEIINNVAKLNICTAPSPKPPLRLIELVEVEREEHAMERKKNIERLRNFQVEMKQNQPCHSRSIQPLASQTPDQENRLRRERLQVYGWDTDVDAFVPHFDQVQKPLPLPLRDGSYCDDKGGQVVIQMPPDVEQGWGRAGTGGSATFRIVDVIPAEARLVLANVGNAAVSFFENCRRRFNALWFTNRLADPVDERPDQRV